MNLFETKAAYQRGDMNKQEYIDKMHQLHACLFDYADFIRDTDIVNISISDGLIIMTSRATGIQMLCDRQDKRIALIEILNFGSYEQVEASLMFRLIDQGANVFDIGANVGWYAMNIAKLVKGVQVYAFEPIPATFAYLEQNVRINGFRNIHLHNFGFSDQEQELIFYYYPEGSENASSANLFESPNTQRLTCKVKALDAFVGATRLHVDFIKCDVEGAELLVFQGGIETIKRQRPIIFAEMLRKWSAKFNYHPNDIIALLGDIGYKCFTAQGTHLVEFSVMDENTTETNFFFLHPTKHSKKMNALAVAS